MSDFDRDDFEKNKSMVLLAAVLQIFIPIIFFLPLVTCQDSPYAKFYVNQGLLLFLLDVATGVLWLIPVLGWIACAVIGVAAFVFSIMNAINANNGVRKGIPIIGEIELIK